jgi:hypothetical protein
MHPTNDSVMPALRRFGPNAILQELQVGCDLLAPWHDINVADRVSGGANDAVEVGRWEGETMHVLR